jgi:YVTN family beta-propeller protein
MPRFLLLLVAVSCLTAADYRTPAGERMAARRPGAESVLPGGRMIAPLGRQFPTGPGPFGLAVSPNGKMVVTADGGPNGYSVTIADLSRKKPDLRRVVAFGKDKSLGPAKPDEDDWKSVFMGLAFENDRRLWASEGNSGRVRLMEVPLGALRRFIDLDQGDYADSYTGDVVLDRKRRLLYVVDQANFRVAILDTRTRKIVGSVRVGRLPFAIALSPDGRRAYVTNVGMFEYKPIPGADRKQPRDTGLPFPAFGFPSPEARDGARRETARGPVDVPGLGEPNVREANSLAVIDVSNPARPRVESFIRTGLPVGGASAGGSSPSGVLATSRHVFVTNAHHDTVTVIHAGTLQVEREIPIRIPGLESLRGVLPIGLGWVEERGWLLVAEAGINAIGIIDPAAGRVLGHLPAGWFPTRVIVDRDQVYVSSAKGHGTGPNADRQAPLPRTFQAEMRRGSISVFPLPEAAGLAGHTARVMGLNGFVPQNSAAAPLPDAIRHVVIIVKENRTFDEVFGGIEKAANGAVRGAPMLSRFGRWGVIRADRKNLQQRLGLRNIMVTPNHHEMARRWAFSDNFYADSEVSVDGHHWLVGSYPNAWTESSLMASYGGQKDFRLPTSAPGRLQFAQSNSSVHPEETLEAGTLWHHLERHGIPFRNFGEGFELAGVEEESGEKPTGARYMTNVPMPDPLYRNTSREYAQYNMNIPDQYRATQFIEEIERLYVKGGAPFPRLIFIHLPNDHMAKPRPEDGYPFDASYVADNDYALGRIVEYLSHSRWWRQMAVLVTEDDAQGGVDHVDSHRTVLLVAGPYARKNYVSRVNSSFPGLLKTVFRLLGIPPLNLFDAAAADLADCFTGEPDFTAYQVLPINPELFDPARARDPLDPRPSPRLDDPNELREQHRRLQQPQ